VKYGSITLLSKANLPIWSRKIQIHQAPGNKVMTMFLDAKGIIHVDFLEQGHTINASYYCSLLQKTLKPALNKIFCTVSKDILLHDNTHSHAANLNEIFFPTLFTVLICHSVTSNHLCCSESTQQVRNLGQCSQEWCQHQLKYFLKTRILKLPKQWSK
jgi:hypothetical protein